MTLFILLYSVYIHIAIYLQNNAMLCFVRIIFNLKTRKHFQVYCSTFVITPLYLVGIWLRLPTNNLLGT